MFKWNIGKSSGGITRHEWRGLLGLLLWSQTKRRWIHAGRVRRRANRVCHRGSIRCGGRKWHTLLLFVAARCLLCLCVRHCMLFATMKITHDAATPLFLATSACNGSCKIQRVTSICNSGQMCRYRTMVFGFSNSHTHGLRKNKTSVGQFKKKTLFQDKHVYSVTKEL